MVAASFVALDVTQRSIQMFTEGSRPIDWAILLVDFLVLIVILWLDAPERIHKYKVRRQLQSVHRMMAEGQRLHESAPAADTTDVNRVRAWVDAVQRWIGQTHDCLAK